MDIFYFAIERDANTLYYVYMCVCDCDYDLETEIKREQYEDHLRVETRRTNGWGKPKRNHTKGESDKINN